MFVSSDEGKAWQVVEGVPEGEAAQLIEHPTDNQVVSHPLLVSLACGHPMGDTRAPSVPMLGYRKDWDPCDGSVRGWLAAR